MRTTLLLLLGATYGITPSFAVPHYQRQVNAVQPPVFNDTAQSLQNIGDHAAAAERNFIHNIVKTIHSKDASFENVIAPYWQNRNLLTQSTGKLGLYSIVGDFPDLQDASNKASQTYSSAVSDTFSNAKFFKLVNTIYQRHAMSNLDAESQKLLQYTWQRFTDSGWGLQQSQRDRLGQVSDQISSLSSESLDARSNITGGTLYFTKQELAGVSDDRIAQLAKDNGMQGAKYGVGVFDSDITYDVKNGTTRQLVWVFCDQVLPDNIDRIQKIAALRAEKASILGYPDYASWALRDTLIKNPQNVQAFVKDLAARIQPLNQQQYIQPLKALKKKEEGNDKFLFEWDVQYYEGEAQAAGLEKRDGGKQNFEEWYEAVGTFNRILDQLGQVFHFRFTKLDAATAVPGHSAKEVVWDPTVEIFAVYETDHNNLVGYLYFDPYYRESDASFSGTAYSFTFGSRALRADGTPNPVIAVVKAYFDAPSDHKPTLLGSDLIHLAYRLVGQIVPVFALRVKYNVMSTVPDDYSEVIQSTFEGWASNPQALERISEHWSYASPQALAAWKKANPGQRQPSKQLPQTTSGGGGKPSGLSNGHNVAFALFSAANSAWDQALHTWRFPSDTSKSIDIVRLYNNINKQYRQLNQVDDLGITDTRKWDYAFTVDTSTAQNPATVYGYSASWSYAADLFGQFADNPFDSVQGMRFRDIILAPGATKDYQGQMELFLGRKVDFSRYYATLGA